MCRFFETIRLVDGRPQNIAWHQARFDACCMHFWGITRKISIEKFIQPAGIFMQGIAKCKFIYSQHHFEVQYSAYQTKPVTSLRLIKNDNIGYPWKSIERDPLNQLLNPAFPMQEVILCKNGLLTDTTYTNIALWDGHSWLTPALPLLQGTMRASLIHGNIIRPSTIRASDIFHFRTIRLFNAMLPWEGCIELPISNDTLLL